MSEMKLSQAEIDALLGNGPAETDRPASFEDLSDADKDALGEVGNISFGSAATSLSMLLQHRVEITTPTVSVLRPEDVQQDFPRPYVLVSVEYTAGLSGANALAIELNDAKTIADLMLGGDGRNTNMELNDLHLSAVAEAMNQMMGGAATAMSTMFGRPINISPPTVKFVDLSSPDAELGFDSAIVNTAFQLRVGDLIDSKLMQLVPVSFAKELLGLLRGDVAESETAATAAVVERPAAKPAVAAPVGHDSGIVQPPLAAAPSAEPQSVGAMTQAPMAGMGYPPMGGMPPAYGGAPMYPSSAAAYGMNGGMSLANAPAVQRPEFVDFSSTEDGRFGAPRNLSMLFDVNLNITVELGRTHKSIREILDLTPGSVLELDKLAGEPVDILVNNKRIAIGEVVVIDENFGVRVTDIISPVERVKNLQ